MHIAERNHLCNFGRRFHEEQIFYMIFNLDKWGRCLKEFLSRALTALMFGGSEPSMQFWYRAKWGAFMLNYFKFGPVIQEDMLFKESLRTTDADRSQ